ncbi:hypothetical protein [Tropicimonas isoalkanivorans]
MPLVAASCVGKYPRGEAAPAAGGRKAPLSPRRLCALRRRSRP